MQIRYSHHARQRMRERRVTEAQVAYILAQPDELGTGEQAEWIAICTIGDRNQRSCTAIVEEKSMMQINYDPQADAIYIRLREGEVDNTVQIGKYIYADVDENEVPLGLEILFASHVMASNELTSISFNVNSITSAPPVLTP